MSSIEHEWWVIGPASNRAVVLVWCAKTKARGEVIDATQEEYLDSRNAIDKAYRWHDGSRVTTVNMDVQSATGHAG